MHLTQHVYLLDSLIVIGSKLNNSMVNKIFKKIKKSISTIEESKFWAILYSTTVFIVLIRSEEHTSELQSH